MLGKAAKQTEPLRLLAHHQLAVSPGAGVAASVVDGLLFTMLAHVPLPEAASNNLLDTRKDNLSQ
jgi:hypothetical protein